MISGYAVGKGVRPAGIVGDIAADGAGGLAAGIGCVEETIFGYGFRHVEINHTGLDDGDAVLQIDFQDAIQTGQREDNTPFRRHRAASKSGSGAAWNNRDIGSLGGLDDGGHLFYVARYDHYFRHHLKDGAILLVDDHIFLLEQKITVADDRG